MRKSPIAIATLLLLLLGLAGGAPEARAEYKVSVAVLPAHWATLINLVGQPFVYAFSPQPPHIRYRDYRPSPGDLIRVAEQADIIVVEGIDHPAAAELLGLALRMRKRFISVENEGEKAGLRFIRTAGGDNRYVSYDVAFVFYMLQLVRDEVVMVAREKRVPEAQVREFLIRYDAAMSTLRAVYSASIDYGKYRASGMKGVGLGFAKEAQYMMKWIGVDPIGIIVEDLYKEVKAEDLMRLKDAGMRCMVVANEEGLDEKEVAGLREIGIKPIVVKSLEAQMAGAPFLNYALLGELIARECAEEPAPAASPLQVGGLTIALGAYAVVATLALLFLLFQRRFGGGSPS